MGLGQKSLHLRSSSSQPQIGHVLISFSRLRLIELVGSEFIGDCPKPVTSIESDRDSLGIGSDDKARSSIRSARCNRSESISECPFSVGGSYNRYKMPCRFDFSGFRLLAFLSLRGAHHAKVTQA